MIRSGIVGIILFFLLLLGFKQADEFFKKRLKDSITQQLNITLYLDLINIYFLTGKLTGIF
jgi:hypothetical protein